MWVPVAHSSWSGIERSPFVASGIDSITSDSPRYTDGYLTYTVIFAVNVFQVVALLALAVVVAEGVHALSVVGAEVLPCYTFIDI